MGVFTGHKDFAAGLTCDQAITAGHLMGLIGWHPAGQGGDGENRI
jgi:hypothetical protein